MYAHRFARADKRNKLPKWIQDQLLEGMTNLSVDEAALVSRRFLKLMAQPFGMEDQIGVSLFTAEQINNSAQAYKISQRVQHSFLQQ